MIKTNIIKTAMEQSMGEIEDIDFLLEARTKNTYFTRRSKMNFVDLIRFMLNFIKKTLQIELDEFIKKVKKSDMTYTKQAFSKARQKIRPWAFQHLFEVCVKVCYEATDLSTYKGYRLLAIDGSTSELQKNTEELRNYFGYAENDKEKVAMARVSGLYDIENDVMVNAIIARYDTDERELAVAHMEKLIEYGLQNDLILFDRGYPSKEIIAYMYKNHINFVMRVSSNFIKEVNDVKGNDEIVEFEYGGKNYKIRVVKVILETGEIETLITSILEASFTPDDFKELYFKRWGVEVKYNIVKNRLQMENYTGEMPIAIEQDFYASMYLINMVSFAKMASDVEITEKNEGKGLKYEYKTNVNILIGKLKHTMVLILLEPNKYKRNKMFDNIKEEIIRNTIPIRPNRQNPRRKKLTRDKYPMNRKSSL